jgi:hypothetical protein
MLNPGNYMLARRVREFITKYFEYYADVIEALPTHKGELGEYYNTDGLRGVLYDDIFVELECHCVTYMVMEK